MRTKTCLLLLLLSGLAVFFGCQRQRTTPSAPGVVQPPKPITPIPPGPVQKEPADTKIYKPEPPRRAQLPPEEEQALVCTAKLDLLRVLISSDETVHLSSSTYKSDECKQKVVEHFSDMGYRVVEGTHPEYNATNEELRDIAANYDVDLFVFLWAQVKPRDNFGGFYSFEANGRGRVAQIVGNELVTATSAYISGKRAMDEQKAAESALQACAKDIGQKLSYEIIRKSTSGVLVRELVIDGLERAEQADYIRVGLLKKPGIRSVSLKRWDGTSKRAIFLIRLDASVKENLPAYLESLGRIRLRVTQFEKTEVKSREREFLEIF